MDCVKGSANVNAAFGGMDRADGIQDWLVPSAGPVYLEGRLVLSLSFQGGAVDAQSIEPADGPLERYRLWDDLAEEWYHGDLEVLRCEQVDVVMRGNPEPVVLWRGAIDTRARVVLVPDLDESGMVDNETCDLRWRRV